MSKSNLSEVLMKDAKVVQIREGSVLKSTEDDITGVVVNILREGDRLSFMDCVGDMQIQLCVGQLRVSNNYSKWGHVPHDEQTYWQRRMSWKMKPYVYDADLGVSEDEGKAIDGILSLLPSDAVDWEYGPRSDSLDAVLRTLQQYLTGLEDAVQKHEVT